MCGIFASHTRMRINTWTCVHKAVSQECSQTTFHHSWKHMSANLYIQVFIVWKGIVSLTLEQSLHTHWNPFVFFWQPEFGVSVPSTTFSQRGHPDVTWSLLFPGCPQLEQCTGLLFDQLSPLVTQLPKLSLRCVFWWSFSPSDSLLLQLAISMLLANIPSPRPQVRSLIQRWLIS